MRLVYSFSKSLASFYIEDCPITIYNSYYKYILKYELFNDNSKPSERLGRKATGPIIWQPATEREVIFL
jgi:hypothetical protein